MAELAISLTLLGGMYILSNKEAKNEENFTVNREKKDSRSRMYKNELHNMQENNFPTNGTAELIKDDNYYPNPNNAMDKYFDQSQFQDEINDGNKYKSLTGNVVEKSELQHNNMVPFFGSKVRASDDRNVNESRLDNMMGNGSQHFSKKETAPLFKPQENLQWAHGAPNNTDFMRTRMNPSINMKNVKPFQEIRVGPGLNEKGGVLGSGGFNAGMQNRESWKPKNVDELRTKTNPKTTYGGVILGGKAPVTNRGIVGNVEKYNPDTYYVNGPERYFTTTGVEKAQTARSRQIMPEENRETTTTSYYGASDQAGAEASYVPGSYEPSKRNVLDSNSKHISNVNAVNRGVANKGDYGIQGYSASVLPNNRSLTSNRQPEYGVVSSFAKAIFTPIMDVLRPSRKENVIGNIRSSGNVGHGQNNATYVYNPNDKARTTIKEMTEERKQHNFINNQGDKGGYGYLVNKKQPVQQERDSTNINYGGNPGGSYGNSEAMVYDAAYNANLIDKAPIMQGRDPQGSNVKMFNGQAYTNVKIDKLDCDRVNNRQFVPQQITKAPPSHDQYGQVTSRTEYGQDINTKRNTSDILNAFRNNPYTKPLNSVA
tara:strand:+ start:282 stop:2078 length:1797 start_codon:yes stop_codon:yes gene_type:complete